MVCKYSMFSVIGQEIKISILVDFAFFSRLFVSSLLAIFLLVSR